MTKIAQLTGLSKVGPFLVLAVCTWSIVSIAAHAQENADDLSTPESCAGLYQSWVLNRLIEDTCEYNAFVANKLGTAIKNICDDHLTDAVREPLTAEVLRDFKSEYDKYGEDQLCSELRPGYEDLVDTLFSDSSADW